MKYVVALFTALAASLVVTASANAVDVCNYTVRMAMGVFCPLRSGQTVCLSVNAAIGPCQDTVQCFGGPGFFCSATLVPKSGPERQCAFSSRRASGFKCYAPARLFATRTPTPSGADTPTFTFTPTNTPVPTATNTPVIEVPTATATVAAPTATSTAIATATATAVGQPTATNTIAVPTSTHTVAAATGTATTTGSVTATATTAAGTATNTPVSTSTNTPGSTSTSTNTPVSTSTNTVAAATPTATNTAVVPVSTSTSTATGTPTLTATASSTATVAPPVCPLEAGRYTLTQVAGGTLQVASIGMPDGFPFPTGGTVVQDVGPGDASCVHAAVVPASGGFTAPVFCIPGLNFSVKVTQNGCGVGQIDSNGGSDYTVTEIGDTSDSSTTCNLPAVGCPPGPPSMMQADRDSSVRVDITVGNNAPDTCPGGGTANAITIIPVSTLTWLASDFSCPDADGMFNGTDTQVLLINQNLDFTTDVSTSSWGDIDGDGCSIAGAGPASGLTRTGVCLDLGADTVTTAATGTIGSDGSPLFDLTFATRLPNMISGPAASGGATCAVPPPVNFAGTATRCIQ